MYSMIGAQLFRGKNYKREKEQENQQFKIYFMG